MNPLDWSAEAWTALAAWATVGIALAAAWFAYRQVGEARRTREAQAQPFVIVTIEPAATAPNILILRIENIGHTLARNVRCTFDPPLESVLASKNPRFDLNQTRLIRDGLPSMPPGMRIERTFDNALDWNMDNIQHPLVYDVVVEFEDYRGMAQDPIEYRLDFDVYRGGLTMRTKGLHDLAGDVEKIRQTISRWGEGQSGLRVWSRSGDRKDKDDRKWLRKLQQREREAQESQDPGSELPPGPTSAGGGQ